MGMALDGLYSTKETVSWGSWSDLNMIGRLDEWIDG